MRTNHVRLYINEEYRGVYLNVEHIDEEFAGKRFKNESGQLYKCLWPADLHYKGPNPESYQEVLFGRRTYDLKNKTIYQDYSDIAEFISVLNQSDNEEFVCELEQVFNLDSYLKAIIFDILTGNWDGPIYNKNNFYLYHNDETDQFEYIPFDLDNTLGLDWINKDWGTRNIYNWQNTGEWRPLYERIMANDEARSRFSFYMNEAIELYYTETELFDYLDQMRDKISPYIENDTYYTQDYGFSTNDFYDGFGFGSLPYSQTDYNIKAFIETRRESTINQLEGNDINPIISNITDNNASYSQSIVSYAKIIDNQSISSAKLCYSFNNADLVCEEMKDDGISIDLVENDKVYSIEIEPIYQSGIFSYHIEATDDQGNISTSPCYDKRIYLDAEFVPLAINEIMAKNNNIIQDAYGQRNDWIELYNYGELPISLVDKYLSDDNLVPLKWKLPNVVIAPDEYLIIWADDSPEQGKFHSNFKLAASGGYLSLVDLSKNEIKVIDHLDYENQTADISWSRIPNATGPFQFDGPTPRAINEQVSDIQEFDFNLSISPNPVTSAIRLNLDYFTKDCIVKIYNTSGRIIYTTEIKNNPCSIDVNMLNSGIYFIHLTDQNEYSISKKFVKM